MNGACLVQQCQTMPVNGVANRAPVKGAASSFPAPSPPPFKGLCSPFENIVDPKAIPNRWTKSVGAGFQKGRALASSVHNCRIAPARLLPCHLLGLPLKMGARTKAKQKLECGSCSCIWVRAKAPAALWVVPLASSSGRF